MNIRSVTYNNRKKAFEIKFGGRSLQFPYSKVQPRPGAADPIRQVSVDKAMGNEGFT
jgi:hypothetical protein